MASISVFSNEAKNILLKTHHISITVGTLYYCAKQYGFKFYST